MDLGRGIAAAGMAALALTGALVGASMAPAAGRSAAPSASAQGSDSPSPRGDLATSVGAVVPADADYVKRVVKIPMRDGIQLYTEIWIPKIAHEAPIILTRTAYDAASMDGVIRTPGASHLIDVLPADSENFVKAGWIRVYQDIRGTHGSGGVFTMTRPPRGPLNATTTDVYPGHLPASA